MNALKVGTFVIAAWFIDLLIFCAVCVAAFSACRWAWNTFNPGSPF